MESSEHTRESRPTRVLVVDDHPLVRKLVRRACEQVKGTEVVGEVGEGDRAVEEGLRLRPDVVVLDLNLPKLDGLEVARRLRDQGSPPRILVLTGRVEADDLLQALVTGVDGFLDKGASTEEIADALRSVAQGNRIITAEQEARAAAQLATRARRTQESVRAASLLTPRQRAVLAFMAEGLTAKQIAARLDISERSVRTHTSALYRRLGVRGRVAAVGRAIDLDLLPPHAGRP
jgi:DNA-binding NarL/FixJ family response regulator